MLELGVYVNYQPLEQRIDSFGDSLSLFDNSVRKFEHCGYIGTQTRHIEILKNGVQVLLDLVVVGLR